MTLIGIYFSEFHFRTETKADILTGVQRYKVNSVSKWMSPYDDWVYVIFIEKQKTTQFLHMNMLKIEPEYC